MGFNLSLEQTQKLVMTPQLRQAITVLQLGTLELTQYIQEELLSNPVLEVSEEASPENNEPSEEMPEWLEYFADSSDLGYMSPAWEEKPSFEAFTAQSPTLQDHLMSQLSLASCSRQERRIGEYLIGNVDDYGYLSMELEEIAESLSVRKDQVEEVLSTIQGFDPPGVGARNLTECLLLQMSNLSHVGSLAREIVSNYLEDLGMGRYHKLAEKLGVSTRDIQSAADFIRTLEPKPGRGFGGQHDTRYIIPDITVFQVNGEYIIVMNDSVMPRLGISPVYRRILTETSADDATRKFIEQRLNSAVWFLKSIEQRRMTLYRVVDSIIKLQGEFFDKGVRYLRPMTLREVATIVGVHESTVSRASSNKYVQTAHGVFELRFFFSSGVDSISGGVSSESVKRLISDVVASEDEHNPLSDQVIADIMSRKGISISRRTVAKYRTGLGLLPSSKRKRY